MMKNKRIAAVALIILNMVIFIAILQINVSALQTGQSITIDCQCGGVSVNGMEWRLYKVADMVNRDLTVTDTFQKYAAVFDLSTPEEMKSLASDLQSYVLAQKPEPDNTLKTSEDGTAVFRDLDNGCYLAVSDSICLDDTVYYASPVLVCIDGPGIGDGESPYNVLTKPKIESHYPDDNPDTDITTDNIWMTTPEPSVSVTKTEPLPQTGQLWWPVPLLVCTGIILFAAGWMIYFKKSNR
ncbi:MAG: hypothetical protein Q4F95_13860 [Oscillospiraceae bacterium]|nr:hypothetical protein [Oscillospiraceae bacterium]